MSYPWDEGQWEPKYTGRHAASDSTIHTPGLSSPTQYYPSTPSSSSTPISPYTRATTVPLITFRPPHGRSTGGAELQTSEFLIPHRNAQTQSGLDPADRHDILAYPHLNQQDPTKEITDLIEKTRDSHRNVQDESGRTALGVVKMFGPERVVQDPILRAYYDSIIRDIWIFVIIVTSAWIGLCLAVPVVGLEGKT
ncbi:hypothetical protein BD324DRAFT_653942 [Kockovaella imperatae]|uniref:Uncharacterized protein n=1 Tax=Kockovaella imperatae TaxID=4999 RepID=A0A1Y1U6H7_9TREE|nr:hypothetical protein BD324DRAFT_653942 [Kockovaella imperatae]ORX33641.1 hypothetical protein BD324DRAFT_653942 [Kockovaella imperatae]